MSTFAPSKISIWDKAVHPEVMQTMKSIIPSGFLAVSFSTKSLVPEKTPSVLDPQMKTEEHEADRLALDAGSDTEVVAPEPWTSMSVIGSVRLLPNIRGYTDAP